MHDRCCKDTQEPSSKVSRKENCCDSLHTLELVLVEECRNGIYLRQGQQAMILHSHELFYLNIYLQEDKEHAQDPFFSIHVKACMLRLFVED